MYYSNGRYLYNNPPRKPKVEVKPIEYAFKDEVQSLRKEFETADNYIRFLLNKEVEHKNDLDQMYQAIDITKNDIQNLTNYVNYLRNCINEAQSGTHRKRRVTICAGGQRVEVYR